jgi:hypothetical protein
MRPPIVRKRRPDKTLLYYQVRRAASSAIQVVLGNDFIREKQAELEPNAYRFTMYRNTFDRFRSLFYCFVDPAPLGALDFGLHGYIGSFPKFIFAICDQTRDEDCNDHLHSQDWHLVEPTMNVFQFPATKSIARTIGIDIPPFAQSFTEASSFLHYSGPMESAMKRRFGAEIHEFGYLDKNKASHTTLSKRR